MYNMRTAQNTTKKMYICGTIIDDDDGDDDDDDDNENTI